MLARSPSGHFCSRVCQWALSKGLLNSLLWRICLWPVLHSWDHQGLSPDTAQFCCKEFSFFKESFLYSCFGLLCCKKPHNYMHVTLLSPSLAPYKHLEKVKSWWNEASAGIATWTITTATEHCVTPMEESSACRPGLHKYFYFKITSLIITSLSQIYHNDMKSHKGKVIPKQEALLNVHVVLGYFVSHTNRWVNGGGFTH